MLEQAIRKWFSETYNLSPSFGDPELERLRKMGAGQEETAPIPEPLNVHLMLKKYQMTLTGADGLYNQPYIHMLEENICSRILDEMEAKHQIKL